MPEPPDPMSILGHLFRVRDGLEAVKVKSTQMEQSLDKFDKGSTLAAKADDVLRTLANSARVLKTGLQAMPPVPAGPAAPIIKMLQKSGIAAADTIGKMLGNAATILKKNSSTLERLDKTADKVRKRLARFNQLVSRIKLSGLNTNRMLILDFRTLRQIPAPERCLAMGCYTEVFAQFRPVAEFRDELQTTLAPLLEKLAQLDKTIASVTSYFDGLRELNDRLKGLTSAVSTITDAIKTAIAWTPGWFQSLFSLADDAVNWILAKTGIQNLLDSLGEFAANTVLPGLKELNVLDALGEEIEGALAGIVKSVEKKRLLAGRDRSRPPETIGVTARLLFPSEKPGVPLLIHIPWTGGHRWSAIPIAKSNINHDSVRRYAGICRVQREVSKKTFTNSRSSRACSKRRTKRSTSVGRSSTPQPVGKTERY